MKLLATDYDCTFYINDEDINKNLELVNTLMKENIFVIATGRSYLDYKNKKEKYNIKSSYTVIDHGATILQDDKIIYNEIIDNNIKNKMLIDLELNQVVESFACNGFESRLDLNRDNLTKIHIMYNTKEEAKRIYNIITKKYSNHISVFIVCGYKALEIISNKCSKCEAIKFIANIENIKKQDIYTIGDGYSDIKMIKEFNGARMKECVDDLKELNIQEYESVSYLIKDILNIK